MIGRARLPHGPGQAALMMFALCLAGCSAPRVTEPDAGSAVDSGPAADSGDPDAGPVDAGPGDAGSADAGSLPVQLPALPLRTQGRWIVDATGHRFKLASVNWYGAESQDYVVAGLDQSELSAVARLIRTLGFNSVRLPWSNELVEHDPPVPARALAANPALGGKSALEVLDAVVAALAHEGLLIILDNHVSRADWCCADNDGNGLWYTAEYPESKWLADWQSLAQRYVSQPAVVAADLRNEPRSVLAAGCTTCTSCPCLTCACKTAAWGGADATVDWHAAAQRGGNAVLAINANLLVIVEGVNYATDLGGAFSLPISLPVANRLVYEAHDYAWDHSGLSNEQALFTDLGNRWGYLLVQGKPYTAPVWVGEFGTCHGSAACVYDATGQGFWYHSLSNYLFNADIDWGYWALNGTQATGTGRTWGSEETYGVLDPGWREASLTQLLGSLKALQPSSQGP